LAVFICSWDSFILYNFSNRCQSLGSWQTKHFFCHFIAFRFVCHEPRLLVGANIDHDIKKYPVDGITKKSICYTFTEKMKFFILILVTFFSFLFSYAQNGDAYHAPNDYLFQRRQEKYAQSMIDANSKNTNSKSGNLNTTTNTTGSVEAWLKELQSRKNAPVLKLSAEEQKKNIEEEKIKKLAYQKALNEIKEKKKLNDAVIEDKNRIFRILTEGDRVTLKSAGFENTDADYT
jgi:hypothetical protein